jgi:hypothetical protein
MQAGVAVPTGLKNRVAVLLMDGRLPRPPAALDHPATSVRPPTNSRPNVSPLGLAEAPTSSETSRSKLRRTSRRGDSAGRPLPQPRFARPQPMGALGGDRGGCRAGEAGPVPLHAVGVRPGAVAMARRRSGGRVRGPSPGSGLWQLGDVRPDDLQGSSQRPCTSRTGPGASCGSRAWRSRSSRPTRRRRRSGSPTTPGCW